MAALTAFFSPSFAGDLQNIADSLNNYPLDLVRQIEITDLELEFPHARLHLADGKLYLTGFFDGQPTAAFFLGEGSFLYRHDDPAEKQQIERFYRADSALVEFDRLYLAFPVNSDIPEKFQSHGSAEINPSYRVKTLLKKMRSLPDSKFKYNLGFHLHKAAAENNPDYVWLDILRDEYNHTIYVYNPYSREQVLLYKYTSNFRRPQLVSSCEDNPRPNPSEFTNGFDNLRYDIDIDISTYTDSKITCRMLCRVENDSLKYPGFIIPSEHKIDTVFGDAVDFIKNKDRSGLMLELSRMYHKGDTIDLTVQYSANLFRHYMKRGIVQTDLTHWYPTTGYRRLSEYNLKFTIDRGYEFICVGDKQQDTVIDGRRVMTYKTPRPVAYVSFNYGKFEKANIDDARVPITVYYYDAVGDSPLFGSPGLNKVIEDVGGAFTFFDENFAPYPFERLDAAAMAVGFGQGSPGLVHLADITFERSVKGLDDKFRAHEVSHQWWGHLVNPDSYHDVWLAEGMAEYSGALYVQLGREDEDTFRDILKEWRKNIIQCGKKHGKKIVGFRAGAITLGNRLGSELSPGDFESVVYLKGACMLHMLRFELEQDTSHQGDFLKLLNEFAAEYAGRKASTDDFIDVTSRYLGDRTKIFFDQWLYDWRVPKIKNKAKKSKDGTARLTVTVDEVGDNFKSPYPVWYKLSDGSFDMVIYYISKGENEFIYKAGNGLTVDDVNFNQEYDILER